MNGLKGGGVRDREMGDVRGRGWVGGEVDQCDGGVTKTFSRGGFDPVSGFNRLKRFESLPRGLNHSRGIKSLQPFTSVTGKGERRKRRRR